MKTNYSGFVLGTRKFKDNLKLVSLFTREEGNKTFLIRVSKTKPTHQIFQPLNSIAGQADNNPEALAILTNGELNKTYKEIPFSALKTTVALFICEFMYRVLPEHYANPGVFQLLNETVDLLDNRENHSSLVPAFMVKFCIEMGVLDNASSFLSTPSPNLIESLKQFIEMPLANAIQLKLPREERKTIIALCIHQCEKAFEKPLAMKSLDMFQEIFD